MRTYSHHTLAVLTMNGNGSTPPGWKRSTYDDDADDALPLVSSGNMHKSRGRGSSSARRPRWSQLRETLLWIAVFMLLLAGLLGIVATSSAAWRSVVQPIRSMNTATPISKPDARPLQPAPIDLTLNYTAEPDPCASMSNDDLLVIVKTGSSVLLDRVLVHLETTLKCVPHQLLVSDVEINVGPFHFVDVIKDLDAETLSRSEFDYYHRQQVASHNNDEGTLKDSSQHQQAWDLDKYKFIPMLYRAWLARRPSTKWFVFVEADTLLDWTNLRLFLNNASSSEPLYYGAPVFIDGHPFAHGGSGFTISHAAMQKSVGADPERWLAEWGPKPKDECCGDFVLARALESFNVNLTGAHPIFQGDPIHLAPILPDLWCRPVVSMHHVSQRQVVAYWTLAGQAGREVADGNRSTSLLWRELFTHFVEPNLKEYRLGWDNLSDDWEFSKEKHGEDPSEEEYSAIASPAGCERMCRKEHECMQWSHHELTCRMSRKVRGGNAAPKRRANHLDAKWISGWMLDRIRTFRGSDRSKCSNGVEWQVN